MLMETGSCATVERARDIICVLLDVSSYAIGFFNSHVESVSVLQPWTAVHAQGGASELFHV